MAAQLKSASAVRDERAPTGPAAATSSGDGVSPAASARASESPPGNAAATATAEAGRATVETVTQQVFHPRAWGHMAESETYAHLEHLRHQGRVAVDHRGPDLVYEVAS